MRILHFLASHVTYSALTRQCPKCGKKQVVAESKKDKTVSCKNCGAIVPPKTAVQGKEKSR